MYVQCLQLTNFRNYSNSLFTFSPGVNILYGPNGVGKSSILEALYFLMTGRSFRSKQIKDLIKHDSSFFTIEAVFIKNGVEQSIKVSCKERGRYVAFHNTTKQSLSCLIGMLQGISMTIDDTALIKGGPVNRRQFLDLFLSQVDPLYLYYLKRYQKAMKQRNVLLKSKQYTSIGVWEYEMARAASFIVCKRHKAIEGLSKEALVLHKQLNPFYGFHIVYEQNSSLDVGLSYEEQVKQYLLQWEKCKQKDYFTGTTQFGPHRDDLTVYLNQKDVRYFASEGQLRSCITALHFSVWAYLKNFTQEVPIILMDDVGSGLDKKKENNLFKHLPSDGQVFLASPQEVSSAPFERVPNVLEILENQYVVV